MQKLPIILVASFGFIITACSQIPSECQDTWDSMAKIAKESGIPADAIKTQEKQFFEQMKAMDKDQAIEACKTSNQMFGLVK